MCNNKSKIIVMTMFVLCLLTLFSCAKQYEYNTDIDTNKPNGSLGSWGDTAYIYLDSAVKDSEVIFIGEIISEGEPYTEDYTWSGGGPTFNYKLTKTDLRVDEVVYTDSKKNIDSDLKGKVITFVQVGKPDSDDVQIKVKNKDKVLVFGNYSEKYGYYCSICGDDTIFYIRENGLYSYSNYPDMGKYDGTPPELLKRDINNIIKSKEFKEYKEIEVQ